jgi:hypothetical protein
VGTAGMMLSHECGKIASPLNTEYTEVFLSLDLCALGVSAVI